MAGYHRVDITKGKLGEPSKIQEEYFEFCDAIDQNNPLMALQELSDMLRAIEAFASKYNMSLQDLITMMEITKYAFKSGYRV